MRIQIDPVEACPDFVDKVAYQINQRLGRYADTIKSVGVKTAVVQQSDGCPGSTARCTVSVVFRDRTPLKVTTDDRSETAAAEQAVARCERTVARQMAVSRWVSQQSGEGGMLHRMRRIPNTSAFGQ